MKSAVSRNQFLTADSRRSGLRVIGFVVAAGSVVLPAFPLGPIATPVWMPMAALWAAYGWAFESDEAERINPMAGMRAPALLAAMGLVHDQLAGGPLGVFMVIYLAAYLVGWVTARTMRSPNVWSLWAGFIAMCVGLVGIAAMLAKTILGQTGEAIPFAQACILTAALFPFVRPLYMNVETV